MVAIVGAGVAGASLAYCLARRGIPVVVYDKAAFPRPKACGEGLLPPGVAALREMGLEPPEGPRVRGFRLVAPSGAAVEADFPGPPGLVVRRTAFDNWLVGEARRAGAEIREGTPAPPDLAADVVVAADGLHSRFAAGTPDSPRRIGFSTHVRGLDVGDHVEVRFHRDGEAYLAPCGEDTLVAALMRRDRYRALRGADAVRHLVGPVETTTPVLAAYPLGRVVRTVVRGNLLLIGDAAGAPDPIAGEGMSLALRSALVAAEAIADGRLDRYARWRVAEGRAARAFGRRMLALARCADRVASRLGRRPEVFAALVAVAAGERRLADVPLKAWARALV